MTTHCLPYELLSHILLLATNANETEGERYTYGLSQAPLPWQQAKLTRYVRGPVSAESLRWDATNSIRQVCCRWHHWALSYNFEHVFERKWRGSERWASLANNRRLYDTYEMIQRPSALAVYRDPYISLKTTNDLFLSLPSVTSHVRRIWFNGFHTAETDRYILSIVAQCHDLQFLSVPWTVLRRSTADQLLDLLNVKTDRGSPLQSLELHAVCLPKDQAEALQDDTTPDPLDDPRVDFSALRRLKIFGNTLHKPICDRDMKLIARTATGLQALDITNMSTISVAGMLALVKSSHDTLEVLEHSPRSDDGFYHPFPGQLETEEHICDLLTSLPRMRDMSISIPSMCAALFSDTEVRWEGDCQVRATELCQHPHGTSIPTNVTKRRSLHSTLHAARSLIASRQRMHSRLSVELFFAGCIFEPEKNCVHGDFELAEIRSSAQWPRNRETSTKGPYGTTGVYGKDDEGNWDKVRETEYLHAVEEEWIRV